MRRIGTIALTALLLSVPVKAVADHRPTSYCSPTGDICQSTTKIDGVRWLRISLFAKYFNEYRLCVRAPDDTAVCHSFQIHDRGQTFGSAVRWSRHYPNKGPGAYVVIWRTGGQQVGKRLGFHR